MDGQGGRGGADERQVGRPGCCPGRGYHGRPADTLCVGSDNRWNTTNTAIIFMVMPWCLVLGLKFFGVYYLDKDRGRNAREERFCFESRKNQRKWPWLIAGE